MARVEQPQAKNAARFCQAQMPAISANLKAIT